MAKLMKPLFIDGMFNREGKRIRVNEFKTIGNFKLWINDGKPDRDYGKNADDKYYVQVEINDYLVVTGDTWHRITENAGYDYLIQQWYGDKEGRAKYFEDNFYKGRASKEYQPMINERIQEENTFIRESIENNIIEPIIIETLKNHINRSVSNYIDARDNNGTFPDFIGALYLNELEKCVKLSEVRKKRLEEERKQRQRKAEQERKEKEEKRKQEELQAIEEATEAFQHGGTIKNNEVIVVLADKYNINVPIRTRGWILNNLSEVTITEDGSMSYRYMRQSKNAKGSQKVWDILRDIRLTITA